MDLVFIPIKMEPNTKDIGKTICNTDMAKNHGQTAQSTRESIATGRSMGKGITSGTTAPSMMDNGLITKLKAMASTSGRMDVCLQDIGSIIICMARVPIFGVMVEAMKANTSKTESTALGYTNGLTVGYMRVTGKQENKTVTENTRFVMELIK